MSNLSLLDFIPEFLADFFFSENGFFLPPVMIL
jgi:hypothetical protein